MNTILKSVASKVTPRASSAAVRSLSAPAGEATFKALWMPGEVFPIIAVMGAGGALVAAILSRNALNHPDTTWSKKAKSKGVALWYEGKYPGAVSDGATAGARKADGH